MRKIMMLFVFLTAFSAKAKAETPLQEPPAPAAKESETRIPFKKIQEEINIPVQAVPVSNEWKKQKEAAKKDIANPFDINNNQEKPASLFAAPKPANDNKPTPDTADASKPSPFAPLNWETKNPKMTDANATATQPNENQPTSAEGEAKSAGTAQAKEDKPKPVITRTIIIQSPEEKIRPIMHEDHVYAANSYTCGERKGLKFCENYKGSGLTGEIDQTYGDFVAHEKYRRGYLHGEITFISVDGQLVRRTNYKKGRKHGREFTYHKNGKIDYIVNYKDGVLNGQTEQYAMNGQKIGQLVYRNGKLHTRSCRQETQDEVLLAKLKEKNYNELILCPDMDDLSK